MAQFEPGEKLRIKTATDTVYTEIIDSVSDKYVLFEDTDLFLTLSSNEPKFLIGETEKAIPIETVEKESSYD